MFAQATCPHPAPEPLLSPTDSAAEPVPEISPGVASASAPVADPAPISANIGPPGADSLEGSGSTTVSDRCGPEIPKGAARPDEAALRLEEIVDWLVDGFAPEQAVVKAQRTWGVGRRMAQLYVQRARRRLARQEEENEWSYLARLAQRQRERLLQYVLGVLGAIQDWEPQRMRCVASLVNVACRLLECRDKALLQRRRYQEQQQRQQRKEDLQRTVQQFEAFLRDGTFPPEWEQEFPLDQPLLPRKPRSASRTKRRNGARKTASPPARLPSGPKSPADSRAASASRSHPCGDPVRGSPDGQAESPRQPSASATRSAPSSPRRPGPCAPDLPTPEAIDALFKGTRGGSTDPARDPLARLAQASRPPARDEPGSPAAAPPPRGQGNASAPRTRACDLSLDQLLTRPKRSQHASPQEVASRSEERGGIAPIALGRSRRSPGRRSSSPDAGTAPVRPR